MSNSRRRLFAVIVVAAIAGLVLAMTLVASGAQNLGEGCSKDKGTITCTTTTGPGNNQGGVGSTTSEQFQGNTSNTSPEDQVPLTTTSSCRPAQSQGVCG
jgi:hypothetical protein